MTAALHPGFIAKTRRGYAARARQHGVLLIAAVVLIVAVAVMALSMSSFTSGNLGSSGENLQSGQALFMAESGIEFGQRSLALNQDWYRSGVDPIATPALNVGAGSFRVDVYLPATRLRANIGTGTGNITVYSTDRFPQPPACGPCYLQIEETFGAGAEFVQYTSIAGSTFNVSARGVNIAGVVGAAAPHARGSAVYPVSQLLTALPANCATPALMQITYNPKLLNAGTLVIREEEIRYEAFTRNGNILTLRGVQRCQDTVTPGAPISHVLNSPVTPLLLGSDTAEFEAEVVSQGNIDNAQRIQRKIVQR